MAPQAKSAQYPLYNTTFSLYRLNVTLPLRSDVLRQHARKLRDILAGEVLRGVRVNLTGERNELAGVGALQTVTWEIFLEEDAWGAQDRTQLETDDSTATWAASRGVLITVTYEQAVYRAILLQDNGWNSNETALSTRENLGEPQHFPLMMTKMTPPLREVVVRYLTEMFDVRIAPLYLSSDFVINTLEKYISEVSLREDEETMDLVERSRSLKRTLKDVVISVGFDLPGSQLKSIDINITKDDLPQIVARGERLEGGKSPFFDALAVYVKSHMALEMKHEDVKILRIACGAFVIGAGDGKVKLTQPSDDSEKNSQNRATRGLMHGLVITAAKGILSV
jgi:hypothetical protein